MSSRVQKCHFISLLVSVAPPSLGPLSFHLPFLEQDQVSSLPECSCRQRLELSPGRGEEKAACISLVLGRCIGHGAPGRWEGAEGLAFVFPAGNAEDQGGDRMEKHQ